MAEPTLGEGLALQSNWAPDTSKVITAGTGKMLDMGLKKELAKQKAEEERAKRNQQIMSSIKVDTPKVNTHLLPEAQKLYTSATSELMQAAMKGDIVGKSEIEGRYKMLFNNLELQSQAIDKFLASENQGFIVPQEVKIAFGMPKEQGQAYLKDLLTKKPELRTLVDVNEYGDYAFNSVKNRNLPQDFTTIIGQNERLMRGTGKKTRNYLTSDEEELYKIPTERIDEFSTQMAVDPEFRANVILKDRVTYDKYVSDAAADNPSLTPEQLEQVALKKYSFDKLENANQKLVRSNIPQPKGDFSIGFGGIKTPSGWTLTPAETVHNEQNPDIIKRNEERLKALNRQRKVRGLGPKTYEESYPTVTNQYDEVVLENKDVGENKTFQYPDGKGGLIPFVPISIRRKKGTNNWVLVGKEKTTVEDDSGNLKEAFVDRQLPYNQAVRQKTDANLQFDTDKYLREKFAVNKPTSTPAPKSGGSPTPSSKKLSFPEWKKQNPNGTAAQYKTYKG